MSIVICGGVQAGDEDGAATSEATAVEAASGLAAVAALVQGLGSFLSPYLPDILAVTLGPQVDTRGLHRCRRWFLAHVKFPSCVLLHPRAVMPHRSRHLHAHVDFCA
jgi:hypothetical protein